MTLNLIKFYPNLLDLAQLNPRERTESLRRIFCRDIENYDNLNFRSKPIRPIKKDGQSSMDTLFNHLTTTDDKDEKGQKLKSRSFEMARSRRLHWVRHHIDEKSNNIQVFSFKDRINGKDEIRTYIYDTVQDYVIILQPQRSIQDYYLLTAYYLNEPGGKQNIERKSKKREKEVY